MTTAIQVESLSKSYGKLKAVDNVSFQVKDGEIFGLIGPNGAGKTTIIKILMGLLKPDRGKVFILGETPSKKHVYRYVGYSPPEKETAIYEDLTVYENLRFFARLYGVKDGSKIDKVINFVELEEKRDEIVANLSGGMKARLSLALALINDPRLLILDEPTIGVDPSLRAKFWRYFRELVDRGATILLTTHYGDEAEMCDRLALMYGGRILRIGSLDEILEYTGATRFEEAFLKLIEGG